MFTLDASGFTMMISALALGAGLGTAIGFHLGVSRGAKTMLEVLKDLDLVVEISEEDREAILRSCR